MENWGIAFRWKFILFRQAFVSSLAPPGRERRGYSYEVRSKYKHRGYSCEVRSSGLADFSRLYLRSNGISPCGVMD